MEAGSFKRGSGREVPLRKALEKEAICREVARSAGVGRSPGYNKSYCTHLYLCMCVLYERERNRSI